MKRGIIAGKFLPPHLGHKHLIEFGRLHCDQLTVLVVDRPEYSIPAGLRTSWLEAMHPDVTFVIIQDNLDDNDSAGWAINTIKVLGYTPDIVFSSEDYGPRYAAQLGCQHISVDKARVTIPISATLVRADPWVNWKYMQPIVRAYFTRRICLVGAESSGTTTLTKALAEHYQTAWVPEYGRDYSIDQKSRLDRDGWKTKDFVAIATEQNQLEDTLAGQADRLLFCDTDSFATTIWHERYLGTRSAEVEALAVGRKYDLYLLTDVNIPFEQDGTRDGEDFRQWMHGRFQEKLQFWDKPFVVVSGNQEERMAHAVRLIDSLTQNRVVQLPGLKRNNWHPTHGF